jgi:DNA-directed RNA polymerase specialized sigma24 family protein
MRGCAILAALEGLEDEELARVQNVTPEAIRLRRHRLRKLLLAS